MGGHYSPNSIRNRFWRWHTMDDRVWQERAASGAALYTNQSP